MPPCLSRTHREREREKEGETRGGDFSFSREKKLRFAKRTMQGPKAATVEPYRPYGSKSPDWRRFLKAGEELTRGQLLLSADHKSKAVSVDS